MYPYDLENLINEIIKWKTKGTYHGYIPTEVNVTALPIEQRSRYLANALLLAFQLGHDAGSWETYNNPSHWSPSRQARAFKKVGEK